MENDQIYSFSVPCHWRDTEACAHKVTELKQALANVGYRQDLVTLMSEVEGRNMVTMITTHTFPFPVLETLAKEGFVYDVLAAAKLRAELK